MTKPYIVIIDDEPQVLNAIERDLRARYQQDYRIVKTKAAGEALEICDELKKRSDTVALFLADQRMPGSNGTDFLAQAREMFPQARTVLITAYADTQAAIQSINEIHLDYYLLKPWDPPEELLYPILDEQLEDWQATAKLPYEGIRVIGTLWSKSSHEIKDFLARNRIPFKFYDTEGSSEGKRLLDSFEDNVSFPVILFPDGSQLFNPTRLELAEKIGVDTEPDAKHYDLVIVGGGPAGLGAAVYGASEGLKTLMIEKEATGGQAGTSSRIENYLGFPKGISGSNLARRATDQALRLGAEILTALEVVGVRIEGNYKFVILDDQSEISCDALIISTGVSVRELGAPGVDKFYGAGVYYGAALTEAVNYAGKHVVVVGGANSAGQGAMWLARFADKVTMLVRGTSLEASMSAYLIKQIEEQENIEVLCEHVVLSAHGDRRLESLHVKNTSTDLEFDMDVSAMFIFIGATAHTEFLEGTVQRDQKGFIPTGLDLKVDGKLPKSWPLERDPFLNETNVPGVFAAGDIQSTAIRRVASAVGQGAITISQVHQYLKGV